MSEIITKEALRKKQIARLKNAHVSLQEDAQVLIEKLVSSALWREAKTVALTVAGTIELPNAALFEKAQEEGKTIVLPRVLPKRKLAFFKDPGPNKRITSSFGIPEPPEDNNTLVAQPDLIVVPGLAFALDSHKRVGFGGGYYDRYLKQASGKTVALVPRVMAFDTAIWPLENFDETVDDLITTDGSFDEIL